MANYDSSVLRAKKAVIQKKTEAIVDETGLSHVTIQEVLNGRSKNPTLSTLQLICRSLGIPLSEIINDESTEVI